LKSLSLEILSLEPHLSLFSIKQTMRREFKQRVDRSMRGEVHIGAALVFQQFHFVDFLGVVLEQDPVAPGWIILTLLFKNVAFSFGVELVSRQKVDLAFLQIINR